MQDQNDNLLTKITCNCCKNLVSSRIFNSHWKFCTKNIAKISKLGKCQYCQKIVSRQRLKKHMNACLNNILLKGNNKYMMCSICKRYFYKTNMIRHCKVHHPKEKQNFLDNKYLLTILQRNMAACLSILNGQPIINVKISKQIQIISSFQGYWRNLKPIESSNLMSGRSFRLIYKKDLKQQLSSNMKAKNKSKTAYFETNGVPVPSFLQHLGQPKISICTWYGNVVPWHYDDEIVINFLQRGRKIWSFFDPQNKVYEGTSGQLTSYSEDFFHHNGHKIQKFIQKAGQIVIMRGHIYHTTFTQENSISTIWQTQ